MALNLRRQLGQQVAGVGLSVCRLQAARPSPVKDCRRRRHGLWYVYGEGLRRDGEGAVDLGQLAGALGGLLLQLGRGENHWKCRPLRAVELSRSPAGTRQ
jgi:hypothetical protein